jgi:hypothetical protein
LPTAATFEPTAEYIVLFAVEPVARRTMVSERLRRRHVPNAISRCRRKKRAVAETRPGRDDVSLRRAVNRGEREVEGNQAMAWAGTAVQRNGSPVLAITPCPDPGGLQQRDAQDLSRTAH